MSTKEHRISKGELDLVSNIPEKIIIKIGQFIELITFSSSVINSPIHNQRHMLEFTTIDNIEFLPIFNTSKSLKERSTSFLVNNYRKELTFLESF